MKLFDLAENLKAVRTAYENDELITADMLACAEMDVKEKIRNYCIVVKEIKAEREAVKEAKRQLNARENALTRNLETLLGTLHNVQSELGIKNVNVDGHRSTLCRKTTGVTVTEPDDVTEEFTRTVVSYCLREALQTFKDTGTLPKGFQLKNEETYIRVS